MENYQVVAIIPAAGTGERMHAGMNKIWLQLDEQIVLEYIIRVFYDLTAIHHIILAVNPDEFEKINGLIQNHHELDPAKFSLVTGGMQRQDSVGNCLAFLETWPWLQNHKPLVLVHDAARVLITPDLICRAIDQCLVYNAVGLGIPVKDTIKQIDAKGFVNQTIDRLTLCAIQTPQAFDFNLLCDCYKRVSKLNLKFTDDCSVVEYCGYPVKLVEGSYENFKITTPEDLIMAEAILRRRKHANRSRV